MLAFRPRFLNIIEDVYDLPCPEIYRTREGGLAGTTCSITTLTLEWKLELLPGLVTGDVEIIGRLGAGATTRGYESPGKVPELPPSETKLQ